MEPENLEAQKYQRAVINSYSEILTDEKITQFEFLGKSDLKLCLSHILYFQTTILKNS